MFTPESTHFEQLSLFPKHYMHKGLHFVQLLPLLSEKNPMGHG